MADLSAGGFELALFSERGLSSADLESVLAGVIFHFSLPTARWVVRLGINHDCKHISLSRFWLCLGQWVRRMIAYWKGGIGEVKDRNAMNLGIMSMESGYLNYGLEVGQRCRA